MVLQYQFLTPNTLFVIVCSFSWADIYFVIISETTTFHVIKVLHLYPPTFKWHHDLPVYWVWYRILATHLLSENETSTTHRKKPQCANLVIIIMVKDTRKGIIGVGKAKLCFCISRNCWLPIIISFVWMKRSRKGFGMDDRCTQFFT